MPRRVRSASCKQWRTAKPRYARWRQVGLSHDLAACTAGHQWGSWRLFPSKSSETRRTQDNNDVHKVLPTFARASPFCHRSNRIYPWRVKSHLRDKWNGTEKLRSIATIRLAATSLIRRWRRRYWFESQGKANIPEFLSPMTKLMPASFVCFREQDHFSHGSDGNSAPSCLFRTRHDGR